MMDERERRPGWPGPASQSDAVERVDMILREQLELPTGDPAGALQGLEGLVLPVLGEMLAEPGLRKLARSRVSRMVERSRIVRGYIDVICTEPMVRPDNTPVLYYTILAVPGAGALMRENHGKGYHFHYSDDGRRRADILLTFSRTLTDAVTWEPHAVRNADFKARVPTWGSKKRSSVQAVCLKDKTKRSLQEYVHPGGDHQLLVP